MLPAKGEIRFVQRDKRLPVVGFLVSVQLKRKMT
jgi:hypothetical protein